MRVYKRRYGIYAGEYNIYEGIEDFRKDHPDQDYKIWNVDEPPEYKQGDWVEAEDGYFVQVIAVYKTSKNKDGAYPTYFIRFPMAIFRCYMRKVKGWRIPCFYAMFTQKASYQMSESYYGRVDNKKLLFVAFVLAGISPVDALKKAFNMKGSYTHGQLMYKIKALINDKFVQDELMKVISNIGMKFREQISEDDFAQKIMDHLKATKAGSSQEFNALFFIGKMADYIEPSQGSKISKQGKEIEDANYSEDNEPPPMIE